MAWGWFQGRSQELTYSRLGPWLRKCRRRKRTPAPRMAAERHALWAGIFLQEFFFTLLLEFFAVPSESRSQQEKTLRNPLSVSTLLFTRSGPMAAPHCASVAAPCCFSVPASSSITVSTPCCIPEVMPRSLPVPASRRTVLISAPPGPPIAAPLQLMLPTTRF